MPANMCFTIRFLQPYSHGRGDDGEPEWPPSPLRVFQALVAAAAARWNERIRLEYAVPALRWLERQPSPMIVAAPGVRSDVKYRLYVPDNVADKVARSWSGRGEASIADYRTEKDVRPTCLLKDFVNYLFPISDSDPEFETHRNILIDAARSITHLGWGVDMVVGNATVLSEEETARLVGERWCPTEGVSSRRFRVPKKGTLDDLVAKHTALMDRFSEDGPKPVAPLIVFRIAGYRQANDPPARRYAAFRLQHPVEDRSSVFSMIRANCVAAMIRNSLARVAHENGQLNEWIDCYVHGHREEDDPTLPRFSYLPLPSIQRRGHGDLVLGAIRRILVAELINTGKSHLPWTRQMLPGQFLTDEMTGNRKAMLTPLTGTDWVLRRYIDPSDTWATVTPVVLPGADARARKRSGGRGGSSGSPGGKFAKAEKLFFKALRHAGYSPDALADFELRNVSFWPGGESALNFQRPNYLKNGHWSVYHARLRWKQSIKGPLAIGAGRHCGLGIFATMNE